MEKLKNKQKNQSYVKKVLVCRVTRGKNKSYQVVEVYPRTGALEAMAHWQLRTARGGDRRKGPAPHRSKGKQGTSEGHTQNQSGCKVMRHYRLSTELGLHVWGAQKGEGRAHERWSSSIRELVQETWKADMFYQGRIFQDATADINV